MTFDQFLNERKILLDAQLSKKSKEVIERYAQEYVRKTFLDVFVE